jgi:hypothetical protein
MSEPSMSTDDLFRAFTRVARLSLGVPLALSACTRIDTRGLSQPSCSSLGTPSVEGLTPVRPVNYVELRTGFGRGQEFALADGGVNVISTTGSQCAGASAVATCQTGLAALNSRSAFYELCGQICEGYQLATTEGDLVTLIDTPQAFRDFLGPIDTPQEAAWRVFTEGYRFSCSERPEQQPTGVRAIDGGFEAVAQAGFACGRDTSLRQYLLRVGADGSVIKIDEEVLAVGDPNCVVGRRPEGLVERRRGRSGSAIASHRDRGHPRSRCRRGVRGLGGRADRARRSGDPSSPRAPRGAGRAPTHPHHGLAREAVRRPPRSPFPHAAPAALARGDGARERGRGLRA